MIFGVKEKCTILTHTMYCWLWYKYTRATYDWICGPGSHIFFLSYYLRTWQLLIFIINSLQGRTESYLLPRKNMKFPALWNCLRRVQMRTMKKKVIDGKKYFLFEMKLCNFVILYPPNFLFVFRSHLAEWWDKLGLSVFRGYGKWSVWRAV